MNLELVVFFSPLIGVLTFFMLEKKLSKSQKHGSGRTRVILSLEAIELITKYSLSCWLLAPLAFFLDDYQIFSFSNWQVPHYVSFSLSIILLDFGSYLNHRLHHQIPLFWRLHRLHHTDKQIDSLTSFLHHPFELITSFITIVLFAVIFDIPMIAILFYGLLNGIHSGFTHFNKLLPDKLNGILQTFLVTPNFHHLHHSIDLKEGNSNFGGIFTFWDFLFRTAELKSHDDYNRIQYGVANNDRIAKIFSCIFNPFAKG